MGLLKGRKHTLEPAKLGTGAMVQWSGALNALAKDLHGFPNTQVAVPNHPELQL